MRFVDIIAKKRDGLELTEQEISIFVKGVADNTIPDYQISAMLMAIYLQKLSSTETTYLTMEMANSGDVMDLSEFGDKTVDKHSTGGVGDKTTPIVAAIAAELGCIVAKMSGRGLGFTGGTVDKFQSIPGFKTELTPYEFKNIIKTTGLCVISQSGNLAPVDKRLYALRDVTATVDDISLIASSIMSKKLASGAKNIVLDVKYGSGAFMKTPENAVLLAEKMVEIGRSCNRNMTAVISNMDIPLGHNIGNSLEIIEAVSVLKGNGPLDLKSLSIELSARMYSLCFNSSIDVAYKKVTAVLENGKAFKRFCEMVTAQGGDLQFLENTCLFKKSEFEYYIKAEADGYITKTDSELIGRAAALSGAGRERKEDIIDFSAGIALLKKTGEYVLKGEKIAGVYGKKKKVMTSVDTLKEAFIIDKQKPVFEPLIYKII